MHTFYRSDDTYVWKDAQLLSSSSYYFANFINVAAALGLTDCPAAVLGPEIVLT